MLVGAIQGIVFSLIVTFFKKYRIKSLFFLAALILCFALNNLQYFLLDSKIITIQQFFGVLYFPFATLSMVFYFFYVKYFLFPESKLTTANKLLFLPFLLFFFLTLFYKVVLLLGAITEGISLFFSRLIYIHEGFALLFSIFLLVLIFRKISLFQQNKALFRDRINWLKYTSIISLIICVLYGFSIYMEITASSESRIFYYILWISQSFVIYWLGHMGIYKFGIREEQEKIRKFANTQKISVSLPSENEYIAAFEKFIVEEKNYLNSELTLDIVH